MGRFWTKIQEFDREAFGTISDLGKLNDIFKYTFSYMRTLDIGYWKYIYHNYNNMVW